MTNIGKVIGWKFDHQPGMSTKDNAITEFPGGIPSSADQEKWTVEYNAHVAAQAYRTNRADAYKAQLGDEPGFEQTVGDVLDAVIKAFYGDTEELDALAKKIAAIKANNPKPK